MIRRPPRSTLVPDTTLFRSESRRSRPAPVRPARGQVGGTGNRDSHDGPFCPGDLRARACRESEHRERKSTRLNSSHANISYADFCLENKKEFYARGLLIVQA